MIAAALFEVMLQNPEALGGMLTYLISLAPFLFGIGSGRDTASSYVPADDDERGSDIFGWDALIWGDEDATKVRSDDAGATDFGRALEELDPGGAMDSVYETATGLIDDCAPGYISDVFQLKEALDKLISETQIKQSVARYNKNYLLSSAAREILWSYRHDLDKPEGWTYSLSAPGGYGQLNIVRSRLGYSVYELSTHDNPIRLTTKDSFYDVPTWSASKNSQFYNPEFRRDKAGLETVKVEGGMGNSSANKDTDYIMKTAKTGVFFQPYSDYIEAGYAYKAGTYPEGEKADYEKTAVVGYCLTMINFYLELICKQILIAQNINRQDQAASAGGSDAYMDRILRYATNNYTEEIVTGLTPDRRYHAPDSLLTLMWGTYNTEQKVWGAEKSVFDGATIAKVSNDVNLFSKARKLAILSPHQKIIKGVLGYCDEMARQLPAKQLQSMGISSIRNFLTTIEPLCVSAYKNLDCIKEAWDTVINQDKANQAAISALAKEHDIDESSLYRARKTMRARKVRAFSDALSAFHYSRNPEKLFFKEQCFLLSYISSIAEHKKKRIDVPHQQESMLELTARGVSDAEELKLLTGDYRGTGRRASSAWDVIETPYEPEKFDSKKLLPYLGYTGKYAEKYGPQSYNSTLLLDGDPYGFLNKLVSGNQEALLNIDHQVLSLLQPFIRLYKVEFDDDGNEIDVEIRFDSYRTSNEDYLFKTFKLRSTGVGLKSFNFTYDGSNPFGAKKSIKGTLKIFANTFDELMLPRGDPKYSYTDLALKTLNTGSPASIRRENENLAKLNFRLKAQVGWSVPDVATLDRMNLRGEEEEALRTALYASIVTLNLTPTVHDFEFDELGRVNFTINYLAYAEETYSQAKFNVFSEAEFAAAREERSLKMAYYQKKCESDAVAKIKKEFALVANKEVSDSIANLVSTLIELDRIYYVNVKQSEIKHFMSLGPFAPEFKEIVVLESETHETKLRNDIQLSLLKFEKAKKDQGEAVGDTAKGKISSALATTNPENTVISFFYLSDLVDTILANIEREIALIPEKLSSIKASGASSTYSQEEMDSKIKEYRAYEKSFRKLRFILGPVEFVSPAEGDKSIFVNLGDIPVSVRYWFEWLTSTMLNKDKSYYSLTAFMNDFMNKMIRQFLNNSGCFNYNIRQNVNMQQATLVGPQTASARKKRKEGGDTPGHVTDPITDYCYPNGLSRTSVNNLISPVLVGAPSPLMKISSLDEINYMIYFVGRTSPTEKMLGKKSLDEPMGIYHYQIGRDRGLIKDIKLKKTSTPGLQEVRFEQQGYRGLEQLRVTYDAGITCYANPNTFPGTYIYIDPAGFSPSAKNSGIDLTKYGIGGYYMVIRSTHNFAPGDASTEIEAKWVNSIHGPQDESYASLNGHGSEEEDRSACTLELRAEGVSEGDGV
jgi:hypothetical protein